MIKARNKLKFSYRYLSQEEAVRCLTFCISRAEAWFTSNGVKLNIEKSHLFFSSAKKLASCFVPSPTIIEDRTILPSSVIVDLGVTFDEHLSMNQHIFIICQKGFGQLRMLSKSSAAQCLVHALVLSHIDYANSLLTGLPRLLIYRLQKLQNAAARLVLRKRRFESATLCSTP